jgi:hypothetical protein
MAKKFKSCKKKKVLSGEKKVKHCLSIDKGYDLRYSKVVKQNLILWEH